MEPKLHKISAVLKFLFNASLSKIIVEDLTFHDSKSEFTQPRYNLKSGRSSYRCSWIYHLKAKNPSSQKLNCSEVKHKCVQRRVKGRLSNAYIPDCGKKYTKFWGGIFLVFRHFITLGSRRIIRKTRSTNLAQTGLSGIHSNRSNVRSLWSVTKFQWSRGG